MWRDFHPTAFTECMWQQCQVFNIWFLNSKWVTFSSSYDPWWNFRDLSWTNCYLCKYWIYTTLLCMMKRNYFSKITCCISLHICMRPVKESIYVIFAALMCNQWYCFLKVWSARLVLSDQNVFRKVIPYIADILGSYRQLLSLYILQNHLL